MYWQLTNTAPTRKSIVRKGSGLKSIERVRQCHDAASTQTWKQGMHLLSPPISHTCTLPVVKLLDTCPETALTSTGVHRFSSLKWKKSKLEKKSRLHSLVLLCKLNWIFFSASRGASVNSRRAKSISRLGPRWVGKGKDETYLPSSIKLLIWVSISWVHALDCSYRTESKQYAKHKEQHQAEQTHKNRARKANTGI